MNEEIDELLKGVFYGRSIAEESIHFLARFGDLFPAAYSRNYVVSEIKRQVRERRHSTSPDFQLTLDYARRLDGWEFEEWLARLLRENGLSKVRVTQASRDQGADLIVEIDTRTIVIQAKQVSYPAGNDSVQQAHAARGYYQATEAWVVTTAGFTKDALDLAFRLGVNLVDGSQLLSLPQRLRHQTCSERPGKITAAADAPASPPISLGVEITSSAPTQASLLLDYSLNGGRPSPPAGLSSHERSTPPLQFHKDGDRQRLQKATLLVVSAIAGCLLIVMAFYLSGPHSVRAKDEASIRRLLDTYQSAIRAKNLEALRDCYATILERFYLTHDVPRDRAVAEIGRALARYEYVKKLSITNITFTDMAEARGVATLDKEWDFRGPKEFAGKGIEEMIFVKEYGQWRIAGEKEGRIYWVRAPR